MTVHCSHASIDNPQLSPTTNLVNNLRCTILTPGQKIFVVPKYTRTTLVFVFVFSTASIPLKMYMIYTARDWLRWEPILFFQWIWTIDKLESMIIDDRKCLSHRFHPSIDNDHSPVLSIKKGSSTNYLIDNTGSRGQSKPSFSKRHPLAREPSNETRRIKESGILSIKSFSNPSCLTWWPALWDRTFFCGYGMWVFSISQ